MAARLGALGAVVIGRFAPTPSGRMHIGNVYAMLGAWLLGLQQEPEPCAAADLLHGFSWDALVADSQDRSIPDDPFSIGL